jgi:hypothetical protein
MSKSFLSSFTKFILCWCCSWKSSVSSWKSYNTFVLIVCLSILLWLSGIPCFLFWNFYWFLCVLWLETCFLVAVRYFKHAWEVECVHKMAFHDALKLLLFILLWLIFNFIEQCYVILIFGVEVTRYCPPRCVQCACQCFRITCCAHFLPLWWRQQVTLECRYTFTRSRVVTFQNAALM